MSSQTEQLNLQLTNANDEVFELFGHNDSYLKRIEEQLDIKVITRGEEITLEGNGLGVKQGKSVLTHLLEAIKKGIQINERDVMYVINLIKQDKEEQVQMIFEDEITKNAQGKPIRAKTLGQKSYVEAIRKHDLVFGIGPAGTGKTYLAVVMAVHALKTGKAKRIILTRPAVEAGESLGFLPGDLKEKVDPYLRPLYDALHDVLGKERALRFIEQEVIEIAPLAYMRGRTLDDAFVILDEAQNTTPEQMKMFLTRLGFGSKMIVTGDKTQIDLPKGVTSGLVVANNLLNNIDDISFIYLEATDVVRHPLVKKIIAAYDKSDS